MKNTMFIGFDTVWGFRHPLSVLECILCDHEGVWYTFTKLLLAYLGICYTHGKIKITRHYL